MPINCDALSRVQLMYEIHIFIFTVLTVFRISSIMFLALWTCSAVPRKWARLSLMNIWTPHSFSLLPWRPITSPNFSEGISTCSSLSANANIELSLPSPCTVFSQSLSVNSFRWRIQDERAGNTFSHGPRDPKRFGREEKWGLGTRQELSYQLDWPLGLLCRPRNLDMTENIKKSLRSIVTVAGLCCSSLTECNQF